MLGSQDIRTWNVGYFFSLDESVMLKAPDYKVDIDWISGLPMTYAFS